MHSPRKSLAAVKLLLRNAVQEASDGWESIRPFKLACQGSVNALFSQDMSKPFCVVQPSAALGWEGM